MKLRNKHVFVALVAGAAFALILVSGCGTEDIGVKPPLKDSEREVCFASSSGRIQCVSECVHDKPPLRDVEREMCLASSSGDDLEYWIDGERSTAGCHWHLEHVKCQRIGCLYKCRETEILWRLAKGGKIITMVKDAYGTKSNLPQEYHFVEAGD